MRKERVLIPQLLKLVAVVLLMLACRQETPATEQSGAALRRETPVRLTDSGNDGTATLDWYERTGTIVLRFTSEKRAETSAPIMVRIARWRPLVERFLEQQGRRSKYLLTVGEYTELSRRLAAAAACSNQWDTRSGKPRADAPNIVDELLREARLYHELATFAAGLGYSIAVGSTESIVVCPWSQLGAANDACPASVAPDALVPCGLSIVFQLTAKP